MMQLSIKRVPTVVSNYQKDEAEETSHRSGGCGKNCLRNCCIPGAKLPLYAFKKESEKDAFESENKSLQLLFLILSFLGSGRIACKEGSFDMMSLPVKPRSSFWLLFDPLASLVIPGEYGFIAQLNEGRHLKKRPTEFRVDKVLQPFDGNKFNFTKVGQEEVLFQFEASEDGEVQFFPNAPIDVENHQVSPIEYGHVLLIPRILECLPQRIDRESFLLALYMAAEAGNPYFRLGYNSLGAFATINHLHFQAYYLAVAFPIEKAPTKKITTLNDGVIISELLKYPVRGVVFEGAFGHPGEPGCVGISGHMVLKRRKDYDEASDENAWRLLAEVSLSDERFDEVNALIFEAIGGGKDATENVEEPDTKAQSIEKENGITETSHHAMVAGTQQCLVLQ
ncbi:hypothetical protein CXB51_034277 [Gossypium anomalum]|uniref:GDP-L-galactose phosphorylase 1 n=1 Tax=Gossypium anomalum TaxID=47600 RepID=A0A8J5Y5S6_9ROSI|nr:hypothetical protein CXB51_034277 [Gossypium anomalum]